MSREAMILFGLLLGGDYDNNVCGIAFMLTLTLTWGLLSEGITRVWCKSGLCASQIMDLASPYAMQPQSLSSIEFSDYLFEWRKGVRSFLRTDPVRSMGARHPALASSMSDSFPNPDIINLYLSPLTSSKEDISNLHLDGGLPDVVRIHNCASSTFRGEHPMLFSAIRERGLFMHS